jgi:ABC-2 type transport system ATP-binding protein
VLLTTHYLEEAEKLCDRVAIMDHGGIIALGTPSELIESLNAKQVVELEFEADRVEGQDLRLGSFELKRSDASWRFHTDNATSSLPILLQSIESEGLRLKALRTHQPTLDDVFLALTGKALRDE